MANAVGKVAVLEGQAFVRGKDGSQRALKVGDTVMEGDVIVTGAGSRVELAFEGGQNFLVREKETVTLDKSVLGIDLPEGHDAALLDRISETAAITRAIAEGSSLDELLEETSAGLEGGSGEDGHGFVQLLRIVEALPPLAYDYGTGRGYVPPELIGGGRWPDVNPNAPQATDDGVFSATEDTPQTFTPDQLLGNDSDPNGDALTIISVQGATHGTVSLVGGNIVFTPAANYNGPASFTYTITDGNGNTDTATVTLNIAPVSDLPVAQNDSATTSEDTPVTISVRGNDSDPDGDSLTVSAVTNGAHGTVSIDPATGNPVYTPEANWSGTDTFTYTVSDGNGGTSTATVSVTVGAVNDTPDAVNDGPLTATEDLPLTIAPATLLGNDTDPDGNPLTITSVQGATNGTVALVGGNVVFTPAPGYNGPASFTYTISDGQGGTDTATVTLTVGAVNDTPDAVNDGPLTATEDLPLTIAPATLLGNDTDPDGNPLTITSVQGATNGTVALVGGNVVFTPAPGYNGPASFTYTISDGQGGSDTATVTLTVGAVNDTPDAVNDGPLTATEDLPLTIAPATLLGNDSDPDGNPLTITSVQGATNGTVALVGGNVVFTPAPGYNGPASFTYTISDGQGGSDTATVTLTVGAVNDTPDAVNDGPLTATEDLPLTIAPATLLGNDTDPDGNPLTITSVQGATNGTVALVGGNVVFTPAPGYNGPASFTYTISDGQGGSDTATVTLTVGAVNDTPDAVNDGPLTATEDLPLTIAPATLLGNDSDPDGNPLTITSVQGATNGTVALVGGNVVFTPAPGYNGPASFTYTISDGQGGSDTATVTLTVGAVNDTPDAVNDGPLTATEDLPLTIAPATLLGNDSDPDGNPLTITSVQGATNGTVALVGGNVVFTPAPGYNGPASFTYTISDGQGGTDTATVTLTVGAVNDTPDAVNDGPLTATEDLPLTIAPATLLGNDTDPDGNPLTITSVQGATNGTVALVGGNVVFTPAAGYNGPASFTYTISDGQGGSDTATVTLTVGAVNDTPDAVNDGPLTATEDLPLTIAPATLLGNDTDPDGNPLTITSVQGATNGTVALVGGNVVFTPAPGYNGPASFTYTISDGQGGSDTATVTLTVGAVNDTPDAVNDGPLTATEDLPLTIAPATLLGNDTDPDGNPLTITSVQGATNGTVALVGGNVVFTPAPGYNGPASFTYTISDGQGGSDTATVTLTVGAVNDTPDAVNDGPLTATEDLPLTIAPATLLGNDSDPDGNPLTITSVQGATNGTVALVGGNVVFTPAPGYNGPASFTYTISDGQGGSDTATVTLTVGAVNDTPDAVNDGPLTATEDLPLTIAPATLLGNDSDPDGNPLTITSVQGATNGTVALVGGNVVFTPAPGYNGPASFTYTISDGQGGTDTATVTLTVGAVNDTPDAVNDGPLTATEDLPLTIAPATLLGNDTDPDGNPLTITSVQGATNGTVALVGGNVVFTPAAGYNGPASFTYTISDGQGGSDTATVTLTVGAVNDTPDAVNDGPLTATEDLPLTIAPATLLGNDTDPDGNPLTITSVQGATNGTVALVGGNVVFTPAPGYNGPASFTYTISDGQGGSDTATVTLTVGAVNDTPDAVNDGPLTATEDLPLTIAPATLLGNDSDPDGNPLTITSVQGATNGTVALVGGNVVFTPAAGYNGPASFTYTISDGQGGSDTATVTLTVGAVNDTPTVANPAPAYVSEEGLSGGLVDGTGTPDTTNATVVSGNLSIIDPDNGSFNITLTAPATALTSGGTTVTWAGGAPGSDLVGSAGGSEVVRVHVTNTGAYTVTLSGPVDHASAGVEDVRALNFGVSVSDGSASAATTLVVNVEDDMPVANHTTSTIQVGVDTISINSLQAGWVNPVFINGTSQTSQNNTDSDAYNDRILWGSPASGSGQSGYVLVDSTSFAGSTGSSVTAGEMFKLADFSHLNWPIYSNSSTLDQVTLTMSMNVVINGVSMPIQYTVLLDHTETPNVNGDPVASRDIITLPAQDVTVNVDGQDYVFRLEGFKDSSGNIVNTIRTDEQATNPFEIYGSVRTIDDLPSVTGTVGIAAGADGSDTGVVWGNTSSSYGTMTANADGTYEFVVSRETRESLSYGQTLTQTFTYTITDRDGDSAPGSVTIEIRAPEEVNLTSTTGDITGLNMGLSGEYFGYNDNRTGTASDPTYSGSTATRLHSDDGTADAGTANNIDRLADVEEIVEGRNNNANLIDHAVLSDPMAADATFSTNKIEFGLNPGSATPYFSNDLGQNGRVASGTIGATAAVGGANNLHTFLKVSSGNTDNLVATSGLGDTTDAVIRMVGYIYVPAGGVYDMRVTADDGYRVLIGGQNIGQADFIQSTATQTYTGFTLTEGLQPIEILYWDQGGHASLRIELKTSGAADSTYQIIGNEEFALFSPSEVPTLAANQDIVESSTNGVWQVRSGEDYTGSSFAEKVTGSDGKDIIRAGGGDDIVDGGAGSDTIVGGAGNDTLTGGLGSDTFAWSLADQGTAAAPARDVVTDFDATSKAAGGDALDLRDLLPNGATTAVSLDEYLHFSKSGSDTVIDVKPTGASGDVTQQIVLSNVDLTLNNSLSDLQIIQDLLTKGKLITD